MMRVALGALAALLVVAAYAADQRDYVHKERVRSRRRVRDGRSGVSQSCPFCTRFQVAVAVNNVGPFNNPAEVYPVRDIGCR